jgi:ubiquinone/menaquinone biosynthesis C-methylase UbiE
MKMRGLEKFLLNRLQSKKRALALTRKLLSHVETNGSQHFLDVGCGSGLVSRYLAQEYGGEVTGIDIDPEQIELARRDAAGVENVRFLEADAAELPFQENSFDIVFSLGALHYISNWLDVLKEIKRVLKPDGYFVYADIIYPERVTRADSSSPMSFGLVTVDVDEMNSFLEKFGFTTIHSEMTNLLVCRNYEAVYRRS